MGRFRRGGGLAFTLLFHSKVQPPVPAQQTKVIQDFGYFSVSIVSVLCAALTGVIVLTKELDK